MFACRLVTSSIREGGIHGLRGPQRLVGAASGSREVTVHLGDAGVGGPRSHVATGKLARQLAAVTCHNTEDIPPGGLLGTSNVAIMGLINALDTVE